MPIEGVEWFIVSAIIILMILWRPEKIRDLARALAKARIEFERSQKEFRETISTMISETESEDRRLIDIAKKLEIRT